MRGLRRFRADHLRNRPARSSRRRSVRWQAEHDSRATPSGPTSQYPDGRIRLGRIRLGSIPTAVSRRQYPDGSIPTAVSDTTVSDSAGSDSAVSDKAGSAESVDGAGPSGSREQRARRSQATPLATAGSRRISGRVPSACPRNPRRGRGACGRSLDLIRDGQSTASPRPAIMCTGAAPGGGTLVITPSTPGNCIRINSYRSSRPSS